MTTRAALAGLCALLLATSVAANPCSARAERESPASSAPEPPAGEIDAPPQPPFEYPGPSPFPLKFEFGVHYGAPLRLSLHTSYIVPLRENTIEHVQGLELFGELGVGGFQAALGWAKRQRTYYNGWSLSVGLARTWDGIWHPLGHAPNATFADLSARWIAVGLALRGSILYRLDDRRDRWSLGWSVGLAW